MDVHIPLEGRSRPEVMFLFPLHGCSKATFPPVGKRVNSFPLEGVIIFS